METSVLTTDDALSAAIGVDTGGTHTDIVLFDQNRLVTLKVPSTPDDLTAGIISGIDGILGEAGTGPEAIERFVYATTFVTNLIVEGKSARAGLITTAGFRDVLEIGRASRKPHIYDIHWRPPAPLVPRALRLTVRERIGPTGEIIGALDETGAREAFSRLAEAGVDSIAVCLFHAYANPVHERRLVEIAAEICPEIEVSISSDVVREFREFERTSTTVVNALIKRPLQVHLSKLERGLKDHGIGAPAYVMRGNGGVSTFGSATDVPVALTHSGPMGGIIGGTTLAKACGISNIITLDMGGTSADISLVSEGTPVLTSKSHVGPHPLLVPMLDLITIGAGGGSIAWLESGEALRVGPRSAGAYPGPACYRQGGTAATVTDCNLVAGRLNPGYFLGGQRQLDLDLARKTLASTIAEPLGLSIEAAALGVLSIAEAHMINALRLVSVERGIDPRDYTLVAFGGAGPLHAIALAQALSIHKVLVPPAPGNLSATGLVMADIRHDIVRTIVCDLEDVGQGRVLDSLNGLGEEAQRSLDLEEVPEDRRSIVYSLDLRYQGQNYELNIPLSAAMLEAISEGKISELVDRFNERHKVAYGYCLDGRVIQIVNARVTALGVMPEAPWPRHSSSLPPRVTDQRRDVLLPDGASSSVPIHRFLDLEPGRQMAGPLVVEYPGSTLFVPPGWRVDFDDMMNAHVENHGGTETQGR